MLTETLLCAFVTLIALPSLVLLIECVAGVLPARRREDAERQPHPRTTVLIPAHNEELGLGPTLEALRPQLCPGDRALVVADNCTDRTAALARAAGFEAIERSDDEKRGKGFAITFAVEHLAADPPEVVVLLDADCRIATPHGIDRLSRLAALTGRPVQAEYLLTPPARFSPRSVVSALAFIVRNQARPRGLARLGLPCQLNGSGMAFPWPVLRTAPQTGGNLVEDLAMGLELARSGTPPLFCPSVLVTSESPENEGAVVSQRRRWEHGHLATMVAHGPRLFFGGLLRARAGLVALALDLMVPPLALLVMLLFATVGLGALGVVLGAGLTPLLVAAAGLTAVGASVFLAWLVFARRVLPIRTLLAIPGYFVMKVPIYFGLLTRGKQSTWQRTRRKGEHEG